MKIHEQITDVYFSHEDWHVARLTRHKANEYHERLIMQGNIITVIENNALIGYVEVWKIDYEQLGRLFCELPFDPSDENINDGTVAYIANLWCDPAKRSNQINSRLFQEFIARFKDCDFVAGRRTNRNHSFKSYPMAQILGAKHGSR